MKRLSILTMALTLSLTGLVLLVAPSKAEAQSPSCTISNTGPDSDNSCDFTAEQSCTVENNTLISIDGTNVQDAETGEAIVEQNTTGGSATSGDAGNSNTSSTVIGVTNGNACVITVAETVLPTGDADAPAVEKKQVAVVANDAEEEVVKALPKTSSEISPATYAATSVAVLGGLAAVSQIGALVYRKLSLR